MLIFQHFSQQPRELSACCITALWNCLDSLERNLFGKDLNVTCMSSGFKLITFDFYTFHPTHVWGIDSNTSCRSAGFCPRLEHVRFRLRTTCCCGVLRCSAAGRSLQELKHAPTDSHRATDTFGCCTLTFIKTTDERSSILTINSRSLPVIFILASSHCTQVANTQLSPQAARQRASTQRASEPEG